MKKDKNIDKLFDKNQLERTFTPTEADWLLVRDEAIKKKDNRRPLLLFWLFCSILSLILIYFSTTNTKKNNLYPATTNNPLDKLIPSDQSQNNLKETVNIESNFEDDKSRLNTKKSTQGKSTVGKESSHKDIGLTQIHQRNASHIKPSGTDGQNNGKVVSTEAKYSEEEVRHLEKTLLEEEALVEDVKEKSSIPQMEKVEFLNTLDLSIRYEEEQLEFEKIFPITGKSRSFYLKISSDSYFKAPSIALQTQLWHKGRLSLLSGVTYQYRSLNDLVLQSEDQQYYTFGINERKAELTLQNIHYVGLILSPNLHLWNNFYVTSPFTILYRLNARGLKSYNKTNLNSVDETINLPNAYTNSFNCSIRPGIEYRTSSFGIGIGYDRLLLDVVPSEEGISNKVNDRMFLEITKMF